MKFKFLALILSGFLITSCWTIEHEVPSTYYTVTFDSNGGSELPSQQVLSGNSAVRPDNPFRTDYNFEGCFVSIEEDARQWIFETDRVTSDITLYARWILKEVEIEATPSLVFERNSNGYTVTDVGDEEYIVIPSTYEGESVTTIGEGSFARKQITLVIIPDSVDTIERNAFHNCSVLVNVDISVNSNLTTIGSNAFSGNSSLESIFIPKNVSSIGDSVFNNAGSLNHIAVDSENEHYSGEGSNLIDLSTSTLLRGSNTSVIPEGVVEIASAAFRRSTITSINIPSTVTTIGNYAFDDCENLTSITVSESNNTYSSSSGLVYSKDFSELEIVPERINGDLILKEGLTSLEYGAFYQTGNNLNSITIPHSIQSIGNAVFRRLNLEYLAYNGTIAEWTALLESGNINSIYLGYNESERTISSIRCTDGDAPLFAE